MGDHRIGVGSVLLVTQVALSLVLMVAAGLFLRTFGSLTTRDLGFDRDAVLLAQLDVRATGIAPAQRVELYERVAEATRTVP